MGGAGRVGRAGDAASPPPGPGPAAGGWAFGHSRSSASQAKRPHPCKLDGAIHGANAPARPTRPASDRFRRAASHGVKKEKRKAGRFAVLARSGAWLRSTETFIPEHSFMRTFHPRMAWIYWTCQETVGGGAGWVRGGVRGMGPRHASGGLGRRPNPGLAVCAGQRTRASRGQAPRDGFTASPANLTRPAKPSAQLLPLPLLRLQRRVQGRRPCNPLTYPAAGCV